MRSISFTPYQKTKTMLQIIPLLLKEMEEEAVSTRKMLAIVPNDKYDWQPHPKSMTIRSLATHIAELPSWVMTALTTDELDFGANAYDPTIVNNTEDLLALFDKNLLDGKAHLEVANVELLQESWTMRNGETIYMTLTKYETIRHAFCQTVHHRAQLGVFLRLLDIPIPGCYGPSADEMSLF